MRILTSIFTLGAIVALAPATAYARCGDNAIDGGETCDDGNNQAMDGCSAMCRVETGWTCAMQTPLALVNGSFETRLNAGDWVSEGSAERLIGAACWPAGEGTAVLDVNGGAPGEVYQDVATVIGTRYRITFLASANCVTPSMMMCNQRCSRTVAVSAGVGDVAFATQSFTAEGMPMAVPYQRFTFEFVATAPLTRLRFSGMVSDIAGALVDAVVSPLTVCTRAACGDSVVGGGETCDDGNATAGDGCSSSCAIENGYQCMAPGEPCKAICGDDLKVDGEECDDGDMPAASGDGCSDRCEIEDGYACVTDPVDVISVCTASCGNGTTDAGESCDDGNANDRDACSNRCRRAPGETCSASTQCELAVCSGSVCSGCYDLGLGADDLGCSGATPACFTGGAAPTCVGCTTDEDCDEGVSCSPATRTCGGVPPVDGGLPVDGGPIARIDAGPPVDGGPRPPGVSGGALCSVSSPGSSAPVGVGILLALAALGLAVRRRRA